ncbi:MAG: CDP-alcohol phosphatidyltransferase family protein [Phycisphaerae bacterium]|nr:CDP-alcohol phosphatidyltransferase family protein [Phycisphaerae bacterium]
MAKLSLPNRVTITRILLIVPFVVLVLYQNKLRFADWARYTAMGIFVVMAFSDALDGYLARRTGQRSRLGYFLDPLADKLLITAACILLAIKKTGVPNALLPPWVVVVIIGKDVLWFAGVLIIQFVTGHLAIGPSKLGRACTCAQLAMVMGTLLFPDISRVWAGAAWWLTRSLWCIAATLGVLTLANYTRIGIRQLGENSSQAEKAGQD